MAATIAPVHPEISTLVDDVVNRVLDVSVPRYDALKASGLLTTHELPLLTLMSTKLFAGWD